jgi:serine protease
MTKLRGASWASLGLALAMMAGCDDVKSRGDQFGKLVNGAQCQISGKPDCANQQAAAGDAPAGDPLETASVEARAISGVMVQAAAVPPPRSIQERLQTESYFAIGSVIAKPREQLDEPAVEPEQFSVEDATAATPPTAATPEQQTPAPAPSATQPPAAGGAAPNTDLRVRRPPMIRSLPRATVREQLRVGQDAIEKTTRDAGVPLTEEIVRESRRVAETTQRVTSRSAQAVGDEVVRRDISRAAPRELSVRSRLNVDRAVVARDRAFSRLEALGLSGAVTPEEGGQMRITIGVAPTQLRPPLDPTRIDQMRRRFAMNRRPVTPAATCNENNRAQLESDPVLATECVVQVLRDSGEYEYVEKDYIFNHQMLRRPRSAPPVTNSTAQPGTPRPSGAPNDPLYALQWDLRDQGAAAGQSAGGAGFANFWTRARTTGSRSVTVAIVDTGLQMNHPDIRNSAHLAPGWDMVSDPVIANDGDGPDPDPNDPGDRCDPTDPSQEDTFHGTHVAGTIGAGMTNNGAGIAGGAWDVTIVPVRALGRCGGALSDINNGIRWAAGVAAARNAAGEQVFNAHPADIINLSIGLFEPCPASMQAAINDAVAAGALVVVAAGNDRVDTKWYAPGGCDNVIAVAAGNALGEIAPYSNFGANVLMLAPGGDMSRDDDHDGRPDGILSTRMAHNCYDPVTRATVAECYYSYEQGTSMAAPHVTAALALLKARYPDALPSRLRELLTSSSSPRTPLQCAGKCTDYPETTPIAGQPGMCARPCGSRILNLGNAPLQ